MSDPADETCRRPRRRRRRPRRRVVDARHGMFGVDGTGDTSGYGGLVRQVALPGGHAAPYGGCFDEVAERAGRALGRLDDAIEKVVVDRGEMTFHVRREHLLEVCQHLRDDAALRFELCSRCQRRALPARDRRASCTPSTTCCR